MEECRREYYPNGNIRSEYYYKDGKYHRDNFPAIIYYYQNGNIDSEYYYKEGMRHREDGPAFIHYYKNGKIKYKKYYFLNGKDYHDKDITDNWKVFCSMQIFR